MRNKEDIITEEGNLEEELKTLAASFADLVEVELSYEYKQKLKTVCDEFNRRLMEIIKAEHINYKPLELGMPSDILLKSGIPNLPIQMSVQRLVDKKLQTNHPFSLVAIAHMPEYLAKPMAIFQSKTRGDSKVIFTEMEDKGINFVAALELNRVKGSIVINDIRSIYPKDNIHDIFRWIAEDNLMEYCHKQKILNWFGKQQSNSAEVTKLIKDGTKVIIKFES